MRNITIRIVTTFCLYLLILTAWCCALEQKTFAAADAAPMTAEISTFAISPASTPAGTYPEIKAVIQNTSKASGKAVFDIKLVLTLPDKTTKQWTWRNNKFSADQKMQFKAPKDYDVKQIGAYTAEYFVYISGGTQLVTSRSESFSAISQVASEAKAPKPSSPRRERTEPIVGIGVHVNAVNVSAGPALMLWPLENAGLELTYGFGPITSYEIRGMYRFQPVMTVKPYIGAGYLHVEKKDTLQNKVTLENVDITTTGDSYEVFCGIERAIFGRLHAYVEVAATPLKLGTANISAVGFSASQKVDYIPVSANVGIVWYVF